MDNSVVKCYKLKRENHCEVTVEDIYEFSESPVEPCFGSLPSSKTSVKDNLETVENMVNQKGSLLV